MHSPAPHSPTPTNPRRLSDHPRLFELHRVEDVSGVSGTGVVADGVVFPDGTTVMRWRGSLASTAVYASSTDLEAIHGHEGRTRIVWRDQRRCDRRARRGSADRVRFLQEITIRVGYGSGRVGPGRVGSGGPLREGTSSVTPAPDGSGLA